MSTSVLRDAPARAARGGTRRPRRRRRLPADSRRRGAARAPRAARRVRAALGGGALACGAMDTARRDQPPPPGGPPAGTSAAWPYPPLDLANRVLSLEGRGDPVRGLRADGAAGQGVVAAGAAARRLLVRRQAGAGLRLRRRPHAAPVPRRGAARRALGRGARRRERRVAAGEPVPTAARGAERGLATACRSRTSRSTSRGRCRSSPISPTTRSVLVELHRVLRPGGLLIATVHGALELGRVRRRALGRGRDRDERPQAPQRLDRGGPMVLMSDWWVRAHWGRAFGLRRDGPRARADLGAVAQARRPRHRRARRSSVPRRPARGAGAVTQPPPAAPRDDDEYEDSASWRVTRPLRRGAERLRTWRRRRGR